MSRLVLWACVLPGCALLDGLTQAAEAAWQARVRRVTRQWAKDKPYSYPTAGEARVRKVVAPLSGDGDPGLDT